VSKERTSGSKQPKGRKYGLQTKPNNKEEGCSKNRTPKDENLGLKIEIREETLGSN